MTTSYSTRTVPTTTFTGRSVISSSWDSKRIPAFLLQEALDYILQENEGKIQLDDYGLTPTEYSTRTAI